MESSNRKIDFHAELAKCKTMDDLCDKDGLLQCMHGSMAEQMLEKEMDDPLGYEKYELIGQNSGNNKTGK